MRLSATLALASLLAQGAAARAQEPGGEPIPAESAPASPMPGNGAQAEEKANPYGNADAPRKAEKPRKADGPRKAADRLTTELGGRVFFRAGLSRSADRLLDESLSDDDGKAEESLESARFEATFRWDGWLKAVVEAELAGTPRLKDAYLRAQHGRSGITVTAGQFKGPGPLLDTTSAWTLPVPERGLVKEILVDRFQSGGRRPGVAVEWAGRGPLAPVLGVGVAQSSDTAGELFESSETSQPGARNIPARASLTAGPVELGIFGELRTTARLGGDGAVLGDVDRFWMAGADAQLGVDLSEVRLRAWADLSVGTHGIDASPGDDDEYLV